ncbi:MAG TPA: hypothetical protein VFM71_01800 [Gemmatimonadaceae bacterium]|nr:hypothetical protein [Gemmatimonadaceae bacterium]
MDRSRSNFRLSQSLLPRAGAVALATVAMLAAPVTLDAQRASNTTMRAAAAVDSSLFGGLRYRHVGPFRGGRVTTVAGVTSQPHTFYHGSTGGGVWKTTDAGATWHNISDGYFETASMGAIRVAESNPNIIYAGTGSDGLRSNVSTGRGVYKSTDAGATWQFIGLRDVGQIGAVEIDPRNPDIAYVAAIGNAFRSNPERGVYRTKDGGATWERVLYVSDSTGAIDVEINPANPNELYATMWRGERKPWTIISGALEGGVYKSTDGGTTWRKLAAGLPSGLFGKADLAVSKADPNRVYVLIEAPGDTGGVYRSDDRGETWTQTSHQNGLTNRPFYYLNIDADPTNADRIFVGAEGFWVSTDGGKTFRTQDTPHGDNHDLWINPNNPKIWVQGNDGGANVTLDDGKTWSTQFNQPTAELYQVNVDDQFPYRLYGAQQDNNSTLIIPSLPLGAARPEAWMQQWRYGAGCETGPLMPSPNNPNIVYGSCKGQFGRVNLETGQEKNYWVGGQYLYGWNPKDMKLRFQRTAPVEIAPWDARIVYHGSQFLHRTIDEGVTWETISPDLTANDPRGWEVSGKPITIDATGEEYYSTLYAITASPRERGLIWTGANDGPIHVTRDEGKTWTNVTPKGLPSGGRVQTIEVSPHRDGSAYVAVLRYQLGDFAPYIYKTTDYGKSWTKIVEGIPGDSPTRVVREDPVRPGLLYAGTEFGLFVSFDDGAHWQSFQRNLPVTPVTDMKLHRGDLVLSTQGRGFWIMDDLSPLRQLGDNVTAGPAFLFTPSPAYRMRYPSTRGDQDPEYPPPGALIDYYVSPSATGEVRLDILDAKGAVLRTFRAGAPGAAGGANVVRRPGMGNVPGAEPAPSFRRVGGSAPFAVQAGSNRFIWDLTLAGAGGRGRGPTVAPGQYQVRLSVGDWTATRPLELRLDPRLVADGVTQADLEEQLALALKLNETMAEARQLVERVTAAQEQAAAGSTRATNLAALQAKLVTRPVRYSTPMLVDQINYLNGMINGADQKVGRDAISRLDELRGELATLTAEFERIMR